MQVDFTNMLSKVQFRNWQFSYNPAFHSVGIIGFFPDRDAFGDFYGRKRPEDTLFQTPTASHVSNNVQVGISVPIPTTMYPDQFYPWLFDQIKMLLEHEAQECFLVDGERIYDPHRDKDRQSV